MGFSQQVSARSLALPRPCKLKSRLPGGNSPALICGCGEGLGSSGSEARCHGAAWQSVVGRYGGMPGRAAG